MYSSQPHLFMPRHVMCAPNTIVSSVLVPHLALIVLYVLQVTKPFWDRNVLHH